MAKQTTKPGAQQGGQQTGQQQQQGSLPQGTQRTGGDATAPKPQQSGQIFRDWAAI